MMWILASLPFWLLGLTLATVGLLSLAGGFLTRSLTLSERTHVFAGSCGFLILGGVVLIAAAKVAS